MRTNENIRMHELIGLDAEVVQATCPTLVGTRGRIVDETKNTLRIMTGKKEIIVPKQGTRFRLSSQDVATDIDGDGIMHRPEERIKRVGIEGRKGKGKGRDQRNDDDK